MPRVTALLPAAAAAIFAATTALACADRPAAEAAIAAGDLETAARLKAAIEVDPACSNAFRDWLSLRLGAGFAARAQAATDPDAQRAAYERSWSHYRHWQTAVHLADLAEARKDWSEAARLLQAALVRIQDGPDAEAPDTATIRALFDRASVAMRLADAPVEVPRTRSGDLGGLYAPSIRGFDTRLEPVDLPITFLYDKAEFDEKGRQQAQYLLEKLLKERPAAIRLEGHTDPRGSDAYNQALSENRAAALADFLRAGGFAGEIRIVGFGESRQPPPPAGVAPASAEHYRLARRVVLAQDG